MHRRGVATRRGLMAVHREPPYREARIAGSLAHTEAAADQTMILPIYAGLTDEEQRYVIEALGESLRAVSLA
jgi:dTDP-4-amino-4,6-dideoxygalactose transaminase